MPYDTVDEAIEIANGTRYGLGASVYGPDQDAALIVARRLECGMVSVNDFGVTYIKYVALFVIYVAHVWSQSRPAVRRDKSKRIRSFRCVPMHAPSDLSQ